jgi:hypothetical protein
LSYILTDSLFTVPIYTVSTSVYSNVLVSVADPDDYFQDPDPFPGCLGSGSVSYSNGTTKLTGRENLTKNTFCVVKMYKNVLGTFPI